jgi:hypothetical protein
VADKRWANFCEYFSPRPDAFTKRNSPPEEIVPSGLAALFGDSDENVASEGSDESERQELDDLFRGKN